MNKFIETVKKYADKRRPTQCKCPDCGDIINIRIGGIFNTIQSMCEGCGEYWFEGQEDIGDWEFHIFKL